MRVLIVAAGPDIAPANVLWRLAEECDIVIACDAGASHLASAAITPDALVGDLDSIAPADVAELERLDVEVRRFPAEKDATDLDLALEFARERGATRLMVTGVAGGSPDHALAAFGSLCGSCDLVPEVYGADWTGDVLCESGRSSALVPSGVRFSIVALTAVAIVDCEGARWELHGATLAPLSSLGIGNFSAAETNVAVHEGCVVVIRPLVET